VEFPGAEPSATNRRYNVSSTDILATLEQKVVDVKSRQSTQVLDSQLETDLRLGEHPRALRESPQVVLGRLQLLWSRRSTVARFAIRGTLLFIVIALAIPPRFESTTRLMPPDNKSGGMAMFAALAGRSGGDSSGSSSVLEDYAGDLLGIKGSGPLFIGVLHSRTVEDALVQRFNLRTVYSDRRWDAARHDLEGMTVIAEDRKSGIIEIKVRDKSPQRAQAMAEAYLEELNRAVNQLSTSAARREREFLENRLAGVKKDLDDASRNFSQFASQNTAIDIPSQSKAMFESAASLQGQLMAAEAEEQGLKQIYTSDNIRVRTLQSRIAELRRQLEKLGNAGTGTDDQGNAGNSPDATNAELYPSIRKLPLLGVKYFDLLRQAKIQESLFESLTKRYEMAKVQEAKEIPSVRVLDPANRPEGKARPPRTVIVVIGLFLSLLLGCGWVIGTEAWASIDPQDSRKLFLSDISRDFRHDRERLRVRIGNSFSRKQHVSSSD
jgi:uncharacterized protein involved in exopolysaccharide biosynthesis